MGRYSEEQKEFLKTISVSEKRIDEEKLNSSQLASLSQFEEAKAYLNEKYPDTYFVIMTGEMNYRDGEESILYFREEDSTETYRCSIEIHEDGNHVKDDYWKQLVIPEYQKALEEMLVSEGVSGCEANVKISCLKGMEYNQGMDFTDILQGKEKMPQHVILRFEAENLIRQPSAFASLIREILEKHNICGYFTVMVFDRDRRILLENIDQLS